MTIDVKFKTPDPKPYQYTMRFDSAPAYGPLGYDNVYKPAQSEAERAQAELCGPLLAGPPPYADYVSPRTFAKP